MSRWLNWQICDPCCDTELEVGEAPPPGATECGRGPLFELPVNQPRIGPLKGPFDFITDGLVNPVFDHNLSFGLHVIQIKMSIEGSTVPEGPNPINPNRLLFFAGTRPSELAPSGQVAVFSRSTQSGSASFCNPIDRFLTDTTRIEVEFDVNDLRFPIGDPATACFFRHEPLRVLVQPPDPFEAPIGFEWQTSFPTPSGFSGQWLSPTHRADITMFTTVTAFAAPAICIPKLILNVRGLKPSGVNIPRLRFPFDCNEGNGRFELTWFRELNNPETNSIDGWFLDGVWAFRELRLELEVQFGTQKYFEEVPKPLEFSSFDLEVGNPPRVKTPGDCSLNSLGTVRPLGPVPFFGFDCLKGGGCLNHFNATDSFPVIVPPGHILPFSTPNLQFFDGVINKQTFGDSIWTDFKLSNPFPTEASSPTGPIALREPCIWSDSASITLTQEGTFLAADADPCEFL